MPELPEVETVRRSLEPRLLGRSIKQAYIYLPRIIKKPDAESFTRLLAGRTVETVDRRGKYLLIRLAGDYTWVVHLRMTGQLVYSEIKSEHKHLRLTFELDDGNWLNFIDMRTFGSMYLLSDDRLDEINGLKTMGPEPLEDDFIMADFYQRLQGSSRAVKNLLLDQTVVAGLGNIYVDEALFLAGIHPSRGGSSLTEEEAAKLFQAIKEVLQKGIENRGTTFRDYVDGAGAKGKNQHTLNVYGRGGESCSLCGTKLVKFRLGGRGTVFCPDCQK
ncbi:DNA-formamidopyrimidine glycosylase [Metallumcola ferriviriculae]|uniref:Formamidopyrimidine-DNA glycosylase n=1 Tax=Metallumcola ferriviriculae TaxID=3039180 RepID=A0AAU0UK39_9FIRM|nr:DNA-formamidopyrimidine glycosylase [Desulfitibacteraceae bacterium MK1]